MGYSLNIQLRIALKQLLEFLKGLSDAKTFFWYIKLSFHVLKSDKKVGVLLIFLNLELEYLNNAF
jgi:hypothetical protein